MIARVFPYFMSINNLSRVTLLTSVLKGPVLLAHARFRQDATNSNQCLEIGVTETPGDQEVLEDNVSVDNARPYERIHEITRTVGGVDARQLGFIPVGSDTYDIFLGFPIFKDLVRVAVSGWNFTGAVRQHSGYLKIWEDVDPNVIACYIDP